MYIQMYYILINIKIFNSILMFNYIAVFVKANTDIRE